MADLVAWTEHHTAAAPQFLRARVVGLASMATLPPGTLPERLAYAGRRALENVCKHPGDRSVALDLLAADALITLALLACAESDPAALGRFAESLQQAAVA
ncbi:MAG TPA: hypothetical protein VFS07_00625 [Gemmatimonadales bacterium]|nr:hypothetical protein [Gemmatimonadales bacterium]